MKESDVTKGFEGLVKQTDPLFRLISKEKKMDDGRDKWFNDAVDTIKKTCASKNADYADGTDFFSNFIQSASSAGIEVWQSFENFIGVKEARIRNLKLSGKEPDNEPILDTYKDRAVYAVLAYAYQLRENHEYKPDEKDSK